MTWPLINITCNALAPSLSSSVYKGEVIGQLNAVMGLGVIIGAFLSGLVSGTYGYIATIALSVIFLVITVMALSRIKNGI